MRAYRRGFAIVMMNSNDSSDASARGRSGEGLSSLPVAIVEDDQSVRESLEGLLESVGCRAIAYASAEEFLRSGRLHEIRCLISDIGLPGIDGIELLREARKRRPDLPVIIITARHEPLVLQAALHAGARHVLQKPLNDTALLDAIAATA